jgi:hypothetical protein
MCRLALVCCCGVALILVQGACGERQPPAADGAAQRDGVASGDLLALADSARDSAAADAAQDAAVKPGLFAMLQIKQLGANCMPAVPADPVTLSGHAELLNNGSSAVGPIQFSGGTLVWPTGGVVATFSVKPIAAFVIKPGEGLSPQVEKVPGSLKTVSTAACGLCNKIVRVTLGLSGAGVPAGSKVTSSNVTLSCVY